MSQSNHRVTQKHIAEVTGVSRTTVAYALKNSPKISVKTRELIQQTAKELGYTPDPMLSSLAYYRNHRRPASYQGTLAWLVQEANDSRRNWWHDSPHYTSYYAGAKKQAPAYGYKIEEHYFNPSSMPLKSIESILHSRNIAGILLCPLLKMQTNLHSLWERFPIITFGYTLLEPELNAVAPAHFFNIRYAIRKMREHGYRHIGLMLPHKWDLRSYSFVSAAFIAEQSAGTQRADAIIQPLFHPDPIDRDEKSDYTESIVNYVRQNRLDAVLSADPLVLKLIKPIRHRLPKKFGIAGFGIAKPDAQLAGIIEDAEHIGAVAVDLLVGMIQRGVRGHMKQPIYSLVKGLWNDGASLPPITKQQV